MTDRKEISGESGAPRAREFEQGDKVLGRCVVDRCVRRDRLASFNSALLDEPIDGDARCTVWSVHTGIVHPPEGAQGLFFDEMEAVRALSHPSIPAVIAFDPSAPGPVVIARFARGTHLRDRLAEGELLNAREVVRLVRESADALNTLHSATPPIFHRALTPERVVSGDEQVYLEECGYLHAVVVSGMLTAKEVESFAQPGYRVPSAVLIEGGAAVDRFLLAVMAFEALTGQLPFGAASVGELDELVKGEGPSARSARPTLPAEIDEVFRRAWNHDAPESFSSTIEFAAEFSRVLDPSDAHAFGSASADPAATLFAATSVESSPPDELDRALDAALGDGASATPTATRRIDVDRLLPMVSAALQAGERTSSVPPERRSGRELPPLSRALDLPPSKPTLLGAATSTGRGPAPFSVRPVAPVALSLSEPLAAAERQDALPAEPSEGRPSFSGSSESRPPDLTDEAELQERLSSADPLRPSSDPERGIEELDASVLEPSTTNTNLQRIMDEIASFRPSDRSPLLEQEELIRFGDPLDDGVTRAGLDEDLIREELAERGARRASPVPAASVRAPSGATLRPPPATPEGLQSKKTPLPAHGVQAKNTPIPTYGVQAKKTPLPAHGVQAKKTPLPPLPILESNLGRGTPLSTITPSVPAPRIGTQPPDENERAGSPNGGSRAGLRSGYGKAAGLPTTTPPPTRLNTPIPLAGQSARPTRRSVPPGSVQRAELAVPAPEDGSLVERAVHPAREPDALARVAPTVAKLTALASLVATVGLIFAARQLDAYMADPGYSVRDPLRAQPLPAMIDAGEVTYDLGSTSSAADDAAAATGLDATSGMLASEGDASIEVRDASDDGVIEDGRVADVIPEASAELLPQTTSTPPQQPTHRAVPTTGSVPGDAVHGRIWAQLSRRVADCVEGVDSHTSVTLLVQFDGSTGMVRRIRSRGIFSEPPIGPCLEQATSGVRVPPFSAPSWDTTFSFPIAPPRWRPPQ